MKKKWGIFARTINKTKIIMTETSSTSAQSASAPGGNASTQHAAESQNNNEVKTGKKETEKQTEEAPKKSQKDLFYERHKKDYPDDDETDEELFYKRHNERTAEYDKLKKSDGDFRQLVIDHPQFGAMFLDAMDNKDFMSSFLGRFSKEDLMAAYDSPDKAKELSDRYGKYVKGEEDRKRFEEEGNNNVKETISRFNEYCDKQGIGEEEKIDMWNQIVGFYEDGARGKFSDKLFDMFRKAASYDSDVDNARHEGELKGHNAKVQATLAKGKGPDGLPPTFDGGQGAEAKEPKPRQKKKVYDPFSHEEIEVD